MDLVGPSLMDLTKNYKTLGYGWTWTTEEKDNYILQYSTFISVELKGPVSRDFRPTFLFDRTTLPWPLMNKQNDVAKLFDFMKIFAKFARPCGV